MPLLFERALVFFCVLRLLADCCAKRSACRLRAARLCHKRGIAMALYACYNVFADRVKKFCSLCIFICKSVFYSPRISPAVWYSGGVKNSQKSKL